MGAGDGNGPEQRCGQAGEAERQERRQPQLRHEHADDEQRLRHRDVAERRLIQAAGVSRIDPTAASSGRRLVWRGQRHVLRHRHLLRAALQLLEVDLVLQRLDGAGGAEAMDKVANGGEAVRARDRCQLAESGKGFSRPQRRFTPR